MTERRGDADVVARAYLRLTLVFVGMIIAIVAVSSTFLFASVQSQLREATEHAYESENDANEYLAGALSDFGLRLVLMDAIVIAAVGIGGLVYARRALAPIRENIAAQRRFIADASHDLRTPLAVLRTDFEVALRDPRLAGDVRPLIESGLEEVENMTDMVDDLLTLSRIDARQERLTLESVDVAALARQSVEKLQGLAAATGVLLPTPAATTPVRATADVAHLRRAFTNVVRNALQHSPAGATVEVSVQRSGEGVEIVVVDHGAGMPPDVLAHAFDRFYRADPSRASSGESFGLGLAIAYWALTEMGGAITLESRVGVGTTATLRLPSALPGPTASEETRPTL